MSPSGPYRLASSVAVLLASPKLGAVKRTFLLCSKGTLSLCRVSAGESDSKRPVGFAASKSNDEDAASHQETAPDPVGRERFPSSLKHSLQSADVPY